MAKIDTPLTQASIDLVIFDCDGVLIDSEIISKRVLVSMLKGCGVCVSDAYFDTYFLGHSYNSIKELISVDYSVTLHDEFRQEYKKSLMKAFAEELTPTIELEWMLSQLKTPHCVATSCSPERAEFSLDTTGLEHYFSGRVFTASEVKNGKPAPDLFLHAAAKMGVAAKNCLVLEDSQAGIQGALAAKMQVVKYTGASHLINKSASDADKLNNIETISHWEQLFKLFPLLSSSTIKEM